MPELDPSPLYVTTDRGLDQRYTSFLSFVNVVECKVEELGLEDIELCSDAIEGYLCRYFKHTEFIVELMDAVDYLKQC
jgi:hypothetical protein